MIDARKFIVAGMTALALCMPLAACNGSSAGAGATSDAAAASSLDEQAVKFFTGQWRGYVEVTEDGIAQMLDVNIAADGTCAVVPFEGYTDLLSAEGTWEGDPSASVVLHLPDSDITLTVVDDATLQGAASDFNINDFETIYFDFYG